MKILLFTSVVVLAFAGCGKEKWRGYAYPNYNNLTNLIYAGIYDTVEECESACYPTLEAHGYDPLFGDAECDKL